MIIRFLLPMAALTGLCSTAFAHSPDNLMALKQPGATSDRVTIVHVRNQALEDRIRREWLASGHSLDVPSIPPSVGRGILPVKTFDVAQQPAAPQVTLTFKTGAQGLSHVGAYIYSAATSQALDIRYYTVNHSPPVTSGTVTFQRVDGCYSYCGQFTTYSAPGKWSVGEVYICDNAAHCTYYETDALLDSIFPHGRTIKVSNAGKPDTHPPLVTGGKVVTNHVSLGSAYPDFIAKLNVSDNVSGVYRTYVDVCPPSGSTGAYCVGYDTYPAAPIHNKTAVSNYNWLCDSTGDDCSKTPTGTWTIYSYEACDIVDNCTYDSNQADIQALFGQTTFQVSK